jgi:hypothetical protein
MAAPAAREGEGRVMPRDPSDPIAFACAEAMAQGARVAVIAWEAGGAFHFRMVPDGSVAVLIGLHELLGHAIDAATEPAGDDDEGE